MKKFILIQKCLLCIIVVLFTACSKESTGPKHIKIPIPPIARAGNDTTIYLPFEFCELNGSASTVQNSQMASYTWKRIAGPSFAGIDFYDKSSAFASGLAVSGIYQFELTVSDANGLWSKDTVKVTVAVPNCTSDPKEIILTSLSWDYTWIMEIDINNLFSTLPPNSHLTNVFIKRKSSSDWEIVVPFNSGSPDYTFHTWGYNSGILIIYPPDSNMEHDTPDVKLEYCN